MVEPGSLVVTAHWEGGWRSRGAMRQFDFVVDEPPEHGGTDSGPMPVEVFLASLATCFSLAVCFAARQRSIELPDLDVNVRGEYRGPRIHRMIVEVASTYPAAELEELVKTAVRYCWVSQTLAHKPEVEYTVAHPSFAFADPSG
jgi:putative redox protein